MRCKDIKKELICYYYGDINEDVRKNLETHLEGCPDCNTFFKEIKETLQTVDKSAERQSPDRRYVQGVYERIEKKKGGFPLFIPRLVPVTALVLLFVFLGLSRYKSVRREKDILLQNYEVIERMTMLEEIEVLEVLDILDAMEEV
ncbi:MAG: anti-sigma factor family protein [Thermodesulfobacteriota bacterium]